MARQNRIVLEDATYHLVTRVAHRAHLLAPPEVKDLIVTWMYGIADFCGVNILAWTVLDNHLHIEAEVPSVPERYWNRGTVPAASPSPTGTVPAVFRKTPWDKLDGM
ncbi:MAG: transposase [Kiritimatiellia bacterium]